MVKKAVALIFDGLGDRPIKEFEGKTPLQAAKTPNLDKLAEGAQCGLMCALGRGHRPGSDVSHLAIFGYPMEQYYTGRGPIEVAGLGVRLQQGDVALRGNFASIDKDWNITDRRAGRIRMVDEFAAAINGIEIDGIQFIVLPSTAHRAGVVMRGKGLSAAISDSDPHEEGKPVYEIKPTDDSPDAKFTAMVLNKFLRKSYEVLDKLPENKVRIADGKLPVNFCLTRGAGVYPTMPTFEKKYELKACCIAGGGLYKGIGAFLGMDIIDVPGATALPDTDVKAKFRTALTKLNEYDFVFVHVKPTDSLAEDGNFSGKKEFLEKVDLAVPELFNLPDDVLLFVGADHSTPCELKAHSADPVPVIFRGNSVRIDDVKEYNEIACARGSLGQIEGKDVMPHILNLLGRLHLIGA